MTCETEAWSQDFEAAKAITANSGQILAEIMPGVFQVLTWDADHEKWRENTNQMSLRYPPRRWLAINA